MIPERNAIVMVKGIKSTHSAAATCFQRDRNVEIEKLQCRNLVRKAGIADQTP